MKTETYDETKYVLVPIEPTDKMMQAAMDCEDNTPLSDWGKIIPATHDAIYRAMISAAPNRLI